MGRVLVRIGVVLAAAVPLTLVYGMFVEPRLILDEERHELPLPGAGAAWEGEEIAVFSDLQVGMWLANTGMIRRVVDRVVDSEPAAVLLAGDFVYSEAPDVPVQVEAVVELLAPLLESEIPMFAVMGNHDYAVGAVDELTRALTARGVAVLVNEAAVVPAAPAAETLYVVGLGAWVPGLTRPEQAFEGVPTAAPRIVVMHNPESFPQLPPRSAPLAVAGDTHCGQIAIPGTPLWSWLGLRGEEPAVIDGFAVPGYGATGNGLFVTCGIGFSLLPIRINAPPQVVFFELVAGEGAEP